MNCLRKIISLIIFGVVFSNAQGGTMRDSWNYRLSQLNGTYYAYDDNGNMTADGRQGLEMEYNVLNLPRRIEDAQTGVGVSYSYLADGTKAEMRRDDGTGLAYAGDMVFTRSANGAYSFESAAYCNGRLLANGTTQKFVTDHLGSVSAVVTGGQVVERNDYYPLGMRHPNPSYSQLAANRYGYNGKEREDIASNGTYLGYGARFLDRSIGRWTTCDPMAEKYLSLTPYNFCGNDSVNYVDLDGMEIIIYFKHSDLTHVRNYKELSFLAKQNKDNTKLMSSAVAAKDYTNIVSIYAHGSSKSLALTEHSFDNPFEIKQYLLDKSELYRSNSKSNRISIFVLHSCETGSGASSIAEQMSKVMTNCIIIAPDKRIYNDDTFSKRGNWLIFSEGRITGTIKGKPKALGNALNKIDSDIESFVSKYENSNK